jgi:hypothetical protein
MPVQNSVPEILPTVLRSCRLSCTPSIQRGNTLRTTPTLWTKYSVSTKSTREKSSGVMSGERGFSKPRVDFVDNCMFSEPRCIFSADTNASGNEAQDCMRFPSLPLPDILHLRNTWCKCCCLTYVYVLLEWHGGCSFISATPFICFITRYLASLTKSCYTKNVCGFTDASIQ